jgi:hypothetical protein
MSSRSSTCCVAVLPSILRSCRDKVPTALYFKYNTQLGPPYQVLVDTNFINFSIRNKVRCVSLCCADCL